MPEAERDPNQTIEGKTGQVTIADTLDVRRIAVCFPGSSSRAQATLIQRANDAGCDLRLHLFGISVRITKICKDIAASMNQFGVFAHFNISRIQRMRSWMRSISCFGVLMPLVDFF